MDVRGMGSGEVEAELVGLAGQLAAGQCRFLVLLAEFDTRQAWAGPGLRSCAHWLSWRIGMDRRTAQDQVRVAHALTGLPQLTAAFAAGRVSYSKVRAITRIATPATEAELLELALAGTAAHVERVVALARAANTDPAAVAATRAVRWSWDEDGCLLLRARLTPEAGAAVLATLQAFLDPGPDVGPVADTGPEAEPDTESQPRSAERPHIGAEPEPEGGAEPAPGPGWQAAQHDRAAAGAETAPGATVDRAAARRADALTAMAELAHAALRQGTASSPVVPEVLVHLRADGTAEIDNGPALPPPTAHRMVCTARVAALLTDRHGNPLNLGRSRRLVSRRQLRALRARDGGCCRYPGCTNRIVDAHHLLSWLHGGRTDITNLILLCRFHHTLIHDHGYRIAQTDGHLQFHRPDGQPVPRTGPPTNGDPADLDHLVETSTTRTLHNAGSLTPTWSGEPLDPNAVLPRLLPDPHPEPATAA